MNLVKEQAIIEAMLFSTGREIKIKEIMNALELGSEDIEKIMQNMKLKYEAEDSGLELIKIEDGYQLCTKKEYYDYIYPLFDNRAKPTISNAALETLSIIAYNPKITRAQIEAIRGVGSDGTIYKLLEYNLIEEVGRLDAPGRPTMYSVTTNFMKMFGISNLDELPELPRYKLDENEQIVIDDVILSKEPEAPDPAREELVAQESNE
ncbi:MAG: SMC-Scp complex subunit ScpB [Clostridia bacterium]|nr:SMC-Scp complex subunit ScpB [Clostridia bacterium]